MREGGGGDDILIGSRKRFFARGRLKGDFSSCVNFAPLMSIPSKKPVGLITLSQAAPDDDDVNRTCSGGSAAAAVGDVASSGAGAAAANGDAAAGLRSSPPPSPSATTSAVVKRGNSGGSDGGGGGGGGSRVSLGTKFVVVTAPYSDQIKAGCSGDSDQRAGNGKAGRDREQEPSRVRREEDDAHAQLHEGKKECSRFAPRVDVRVVRPSVRPSARESSESSVSGAPQCIADNVG